MNTDETLTRHRPTARLSDEQRDATLGAVLGLRSSPAAYAGPGRHDEHDERVVMVFDEHRPSRRSRRVWLPAAAAAVLVGAMALVTWHLSGRPGTGGMSAASDARSVCRAPLPAAWKAAYSSAPIQVDGRAAFPVASDPAGDLVLGWYPSAKQTGYSLQRPDGTLRRIGVFPGGAFSSLSDPEKTRWSVVATDGDRVVLTRTVQRTTQSPDTYNRDAVINDVAVVDLATGHRTHLLARAPMRAGWTIRSDIQLYNGVVYWGATPYGDDHRGIVIGYDLARARFDRLADLKQFPWVLGDSRGVAWPGGSVASPDVPSALGPQLDSSGEPADRFYTDGDSYAWQTIAGDQTVVHWADQAGDVRTFRIAGLDHGSDTGGPTGVAGPFVFLHVNVSGKSDSVLDTRTGAVAAVGTQIVESYPGRRLYAMTGAFEYLPIDAAKLPALHC